MADEKKYIEVSEAISRALEVLPVGGVMDAVESALLDIPAADVRPVVHGSWMSDLREDWAGWCHCSECGDRLPKLYAKRFCGNCGADMRETEVPK